MSDNTGSPAGEKSLGEILYSGGGEGRAAVCHLVAWIHLVARIGRLASGAGRCRTTAPSLTLGPLPCRSKPRQPVAATFRSSDTGCQLGGVGRRSARPRQPDRVVHAGGGR